MNAPLKTLAVGTAALLFAASAADAATFNFDSDTGLTPVTLTLDSGVPTPVPPAGEFLESVDWTLGLSFLKDLTVTNNSSETATLFELRAGVRTQGPFSSVLPISWNLPAPPPAVLSAATTLVDAGTDPTGIQIAAGDSLTFSGITGSGSISGSQTTNMGDWLSLADGPSVTAFILASVTLEFLGGNLEFTQTTNATLDGEITYNYTPIPLPAAGWLLLSGVAGLGGIGWMRRRAA